VNSALLFNFLLGGGLRFLLKKDVLFHTGGKHVRQIQISNVEKLWRE
jgi:hypothetical protein